MPSNPLEAYQSVEMATMSGRELEALVLNKAAAKLLAVQQEWDAPDRDQRLEEALKYNQRLWSIFQAEVSRNDNQLPNEVKVNILALSDFIDRRTFDLLVFPEKRKLDILININRNIASGLQGVRE